MKQVLKKILPPFIRKGIHHQLNQARKIWFRGNTYYCICCDHHYSSFLDMKEGSHPRKQVCCPGCGSVERHRMLLRYLKANEQDFFKRGTRVLYIAPMIGIRQYFKRMDNIEYLGADLESSLAEVHFDLQDIPYSNDSFDFCICSHTLAHIKDDGLALSEINRVLSNEGILIVLERNYPIPSTHDLKKDLSAEDRLKEYDQSDRWRIYGEDFPSYLSSFGFNVTPINYGESLEQEIIDKEVIDQSEIIYLCRNNT